MNKIYQGTVRFFLLIFLLPISLVSAQDDKLSQKCSLTFGWDEVKPYQYRSPEGKVIGFQVDLVRSIVSETGCTLKLKQGVWNELLNQLKTGEIDFMADMTITEPRKEFGIFSDTYRLESYTMYVRETDYGKYKDMSFSRMLEDGFHLGLTEGFIYNQEIQSLRNSLKFSKNFSTVDHNPKNYSRLVKGEIDGFLEDSMVAGYTLRNLRVDGLIKGMPLEFYTGAISFMFSKKTVEVSFVDEFNKAMAKIKNTDEYRKAWIRDIH